MIIDPPTDSEANLNSHSFKGTVEGLTEAFPGMAMIKVTNIPPYTSQDALVFFFENRRRSGGGDIKELEYDPDTKSAVITFEDPEGRM